MTTSFDRPRGRCPGTGRRAALTPGLLLFAGCATAAQDRDVTQASRREEGYDPDHRNWWWAEYDPDGSLQTDPQAMPLAGRVAKGAEQGCIACHQAAAGDDYVFSHDRFGG